MGDWFALALMSFGGATLGGLGARYGPRLFRRAPVPEPELAIAPPPAPEVAVPPYDRPTMEMIIRRVADLEEQNGRLWRALYRRDGGPPSTPRTTDPS